MTGAPEIGDDADENENRLNTLTQEDEKRLEEHPPAARLSPRCLELCHLGLYHIEELCALGLDLRLRCTRADGFFQCVELILREVRALGGDAAAHSALQTVFLIDAVVDIVDGILCTFCIPRLIDGIDTVHLRRDMVVNLLPCLRGVRRRRRQEQKECRNECKQLSHWIVCVPLSFIC